MTDHPRSLILVLGPQGSGKGTQIALLREQCGLPAVSAGELLRQTDPRTDLGRHVHALIDQGKLVTLDLWQAVVGDYLDHADLSQGYLLDGVVRTMEQEALFSPMLTDRQLPPASVLSITLDDGAAIERLLKRAAIEGRADDTAAGIRQRLSLMRSVTQPVIDHYRSIGRCVEVNGHQTIEAVHADIVAGLTAAHLLPQGSDGHC